MLKFRVGFTVSNSKIIIQINGIEYSSCEGDTIINIADKNGIYIPRFCYHKNLSVAANCRMCLVEIEGSNKPSPACATPVYDGMKIRTTSKKTIHSQKSVMEFLLINHPLDCPICDQGGECDLQDLAMGYGKGYSRYNEGKRVFKNLDLGPLIATDMTRCIQCTRCVRFSEEIAGDKELGSMNRADVTEISTFIEKTINSELSGNMIDLCPVGALTSKPYRYTARPWELVQKETISGADSVGSNIYVHVRRNKIMRVVPKENKEINETWISDKDRFMYTGVYSEERIKKPMVKKDGEWCEISWDEALKTVISIIDDSRKDPDKIATLASDFCTVEELYLLQKMTRHFGSNNIDTRIRQISYEEGVHTGIGFNCSIDEIEKSDVILVLGSNLRKESPLINHRVRKAYKKGAKIITINNQSYDFNYSTEDILVESTEFAHMIASIVKVLSYKLSSFVLKNKIKDLLSEVSISTQTDQIAYKLSTAKSPCLIMGYDIVVNKNFYYIFILFLELSNILNAKRGILSYGCNTVGALRVGATPNFLPKFKKINHPGKNVREILSPGSTNTLFIAGLELENDSIFGPSILKNLRDIENVIVMSAFCNKNMLEYADLILPTTTHFETDGTFINISGQVQHFQSVIPTLFDSKPMWKIIRVIGNLADIDGFNYNQSKDVFNEFDTMVSQEHSFELKGNNTINISSTISDNFTIIPLIPTYKSSSLLRRSEPLQYTEDGKNHNIVKLTSYANYKKYQQESDIISIKIGDTEFSIPCIVDDKISKRTIIIPVELIPEKMDNFFDIFGVNVGLEIKI